MTVLLQPRLRPLHGRLLQPLQRKGPILASRDKAHAWSGLSRLLGALLGLV